MTNVSCQVISVSAETPWLGRAQHILLAAQSQILAFYKKAYVSTGCFPPLSYCIRVHAGPPQRDCPSQVLGVYQVSPDCVRPLHARAADRPSYRGTFFERGIGWIFPDATPEIGNLLLSPKPAQYVRRSFLFVPDDDRSQKWSP